MITIGAIHSGATSLAPVLEDALKTHIKEYRLINIIDDSLIHAVIEDGAVTHKTTKRVVNLCEALMLAGADVVVDTCSSIGEAAEIANQMLDRPVIRIDQGMVNEAVNHYTRIGVLASLSTTLEPTVACLRRTAEQAGKKVEVHSLVADGAFEKWVAGDTQGHDDLLIDAARELADTEVILLAQVSMMRVQERMRKEIDKPVLSGPAFCAEQIGRMFAGC